MEGGRYRTQDLSLAVPNLTRQLCSPKLSTKKAINVLVLYCNPMFSVSTVVSHPTHHIFCHVGTDPMLLVSIN